MRQLIVSDIHANLPALEAVLRDAEGRYDEAVCLGDVTGYGASPEDVIDWARHATKITIRGNHDRACAGGATNHGFNPMARAAAEWTYARLDDDRRHWLRDLPQGPFEESGCTFVHGAPDDEDGYILNTSDAMDAFCGFESSVCFFGHSHRQGGYQLRGRLCQQLDAPPARQQEQAVTLLPECRYLLNPGAVGQPRDGDPRAGYLLFDSEKREALFRRVRYDVERAQRAIRAAGLPDLLAERLAAGH